MRDLLARLFPKRGARGCQHTNLTPAEDIAIAEQVLAEGDLPHAVHHVACALATDPQRTEWLALLDRILDIATDPLATVPVPDGKPVYFGDAAVRAYVLHRLRRSPEALGLLLSVLLARPVVAYAAWAKAWSEEPDAGALVGEVQSFLQALSQALETRSEPYPAEIVTTLVTAWNALPECAESELYGFLTVRVLRQLGALDAALAQGRWYEERHATPIAAVVLGGVFKAQGAIADAIASYRAALARPNQGPLAAGFDALSVQLDIGDTEWMRGELIAAKAAYDAVLAAQPEHPWALPSLYAVSWEESRDAGWKVKLTTYAQQNPGNDRAKFLVQQLR